MMIFDGIERCIDVYALVRRILCRFTGGCHLMMQEWCRLCGGRRERLKTPEPRDFRVAFLPHRETAPQASIHER